jgi:hypothetical protein
VVIPGSGSPGERLSRLVIRSYHRVRRREDLSRVIGVMSGVENRVDDRPSNIMRRTDHRIAFADYLDRLAGGDDDKAEWLNYIIQHYYGDDFLEDIRRQVVRLSICYPEGHPNGRWSDTDREILRSLARDLRDPANASSES